MRVAVYHNLSSGGARRILHGLCRYLSAEHIVDVFTLSSSDQDTVKDSEVVSSVTVLPFAQRPPMRRGLYVNDLRRFRDLADLDRIGRVLAARIDNGGYDTVFVEACQFTFGPAVLRYLETPAAFYFNGSPGWLEGRQWRPPSTARIRAARLLSTPASLAVDRNLRRGDARSVRAARAVLTNSRHSQTRIKKAYGVDATLCPPGVDLWPASPPSEGDYVLSVGAIENRKGYDFLIDAIARVAHRRRPRLIVAANAADPLVRSRIEGRAAASGVDLHIRLHVLDAPLSKLYYEALAFVYGSHEEPLGMAPLEAMAHAKPVVAVGEGGVIETVVDGVTGVLVQRDPLVFAETLERLLADAELRKVMGAAGRNEVESRWTWRSRGPAYVSALRRLATRPPQP